MYNFIHISAFTYASTHYSFKEVTCHNKSLNIRLHSCLMNRPDWLKRIFPSGLHFVRHFFSSYLHTCLVASFSVCPPTNRSPPHSTCVAALQRRCVDSLSGGFINCAQLRSVQHTYIFTYTYSYLCNYILRQVCMYHRLSSLLYMRAMRLLMSLRATWLIAEKLAVVVYFSIWNL